MDIKASKRFEKTFNKLSSKMKKLMVQAIEQLPEGDINLLKESTLLPLAIVYGKVSIEFYSKCSEDPRQATALAAG